MHNGLSNTTSTNYDTQQHLLILETLDTEEATYLWHLNKQPAFLRQQLQAVDHDLKRIRNQSRQAFLVNPPRNFSRIVHQYTKDRERFIRWKAALEEVMGCGGLLL